MKFKAQLTASVCVLMLCSSGLRATSATTLFDFPAWADHLDEVNIADFTGYSFGTIITTQYQHLGVIFPDGTDYVTGPDFIFVDNWGLNGQQSPIYMEFLAPRLEIGLLFIGDLHVRLYRNKSLIFESDFYAGAGFVGFIADTPFDSAELIGFFNGTVNIDNLYFGPPVVPGDLDGDADVDGIDLGILLGSWSIPVGGPGCDGKKGPCAADLNQDGVVDGLDLGILLDAWTF